MSDKIKVGIIGCGGIANGKHLPSLKTQFDRLEIGRDVQRGQRG